MTQTVPASMTDEGVTAAQVTSLQSRATALESRASALEAGTSLPAGVVMTAGTLVNTTSGTAPDLSTAIPATAKRVVVLLNGVSLSGTANVLLQIGSGSYSTSGYAGGVSQAGTSPGQSTSTAGLQVCSSSTAAVTHTGIINLWTMGGNVWVGTATTTRSDGYGQQGATAITLAGALDRVRLYTTNGTDTFDAGSALIYYA